MNENLIIIFTGYVQKKLIDIEEVPVFVREEVRKAVSEENMI